MSLKRLQQLAEQFNAVAPDEYEDLAATCRDLAVNRLDVRYMVLGECLLLSKTFWGDGEGGGVGPRFCKAFTRIWMDFLPGALRAGAEEEGVVVALALLEELHGLANDDRLA